MTTTQGAMPVRLIKYGTDARNSVGLNPVSGKLDDHNSRSRAHWALWSEYTDEFSASYVGEVMEHTPAPCALANVYGRHHGGSRVETRELPIVRRTMTTEFPIVNVPAHLLPRMFDELDGPSWSDDMRKHLRSFIDAGVPLVEPDDILLSEHDVLEDNCPECGSDGNCVRSCSVGGEL